MKRLLIACAACVSQTVPAQSPVAVPISVEPLVYERGNAVHGCGMRITGGETRDGDSSWFDVSVNLFRRGIGIAQSIAYEMQRSEYDGRSRPARVPVQSTWIAASDNGTRLGESIERRETLIYRLISDDVLSLFEAVATARPITLGVKRWGQPAAVVYSGTPIVTAESRLQIGDCLGQLAAAYPQD